MKKFEVGKTYRDAENGGIEIEVLKRTAKTITFIFTKASWWGAYIDETKTFRKTINFSRTEAESIALENDYSAPRITAE